MKAWRLVLLVVVVCLCGSVPVLGQAGIHDGPAGLSPECVHYGVGTCAEGCSPRCPEGWERTSCHSPEENDPEPTKGSMCVWRNIIVSGICCRRPTSLPPYFVVKWDQRGFAAFYRTDGSLVVVSLIERTPQGDFAASVAEFPGSEIFRADVFFADGVYAGTVCESGGWPKAYDSCAE